MTDKNVRNNDMIKVVLLEPGKVARAAEIDSTLRGMQKVVGGYIEAIYPFPEDVCVVCNEEGKINGMRLNRGMKDDEGKITDIIAGPCFICDCRGEKFGSLSDDQIERYTEKFKLPERFMKFEGEIIAVPYQPKDKFLER